LELLFIPPVRVAAGGGGSRKAQVLEVQEPMFADLLATVAARIGE
jgi:hypothetical protein